jgi:hypothetical protein
VKFRYKRLISKPLIIAPSTSEYSDDFHETIPLSISLFPLSSMEDGDEGVETLGRYISG